MRKYLVVLVALVMVLGLSGMAMAVEGSLESGSLSVPAPVTAAVAKYASLVVASPDKLQFEGKKDEYKEALNGKITKEANCKVTATAEVTKALTITVGGVDYTIYTNVDIDGT